MRKTIKKRTLVKRKKTSDKTKRPPDDIKQLRLIARKVMQRMNVLLDSQTKDNAQELFGGRYSLVAALNTLAELVLELEARKHVTAKKSANADKDTALPLSEADVQLLEQFIAKQKGNA